jgi:hypothetical protein
VNVKRDQKPYTKYPPPLPAHGLLILLGVVLLVTVIVASCSPTAKSEGPAGPQGPVGQAVATYQGKVATYQGKDVRWWAARAQQARRDANARRLTIRRLRRTLAYSPTIREAVKLATIVYPAFSEARAWAIIRHESQGNPNAKNRSSSAAGLYQFLDSTWRSTPFGRAGLSVFDPFAASLGAGWMHAQGRRCEWWC